MERLTEYHNGVAVIRDKSRLKDAMAKLAEYETAEEQGLLIRLPCKTEDNLYVIRHGCVQERFIIDFEVYGKEIVANCNYGEFYIDEIGKTAFLTKEEAKAKLKQLEKTHQMTQEEREQFFREG